MISSFLKSSPNPFSNTCFQPRYPIFLITCTTISVFLLSLLPFHFTIKYQWALFSYICKQIMFFCATASLFNCFTFSTLILPAGFATYMLILSVSSFSFFAQLWTFKLSIAICNTPLLNHSPYVKFVTIISRPCSLLCPSNCLFPYFIQPPPLLQIWVSVIFSYKIPHWILSVSFHPSSKPYISTPYTGLLDSRNIS